MNFKKLAITAAAGALMLGSAVPAFAGGPWMPPMPSNDISIKNNAFVTNNVKTNAEVSKNFVSSKFGSAKIMVGAVGAASNVANNVNSSYVDTCNQCGLFGGDTKVKNNAFVSNNVKTNAEVESNFVSGGSMFGGAGIYAGAVGATGAVSNVVNTTIIGDAAN